MRSARRAGIATNDVKPVKGRPARMLRGEPESQQSRRAQEITDSFDASAGSLAALAEKRAGRDCEVESSRPALQTDASWRVACRRIGWGIINTAPRQYAPRGLSQEGQQRTAGEVEPSRMGD